MLSFGNNEVIKCINRSLFAQILSATESFLFEALIDFEFSTT